LPRCPCTVLMFVISFKLRQGEILVEPPALKSLSQGGIFLIMKFEIITIFPNLFTNFLNESLLARAQKKRLLKIKTHDLRRWTTNNHKTVDDRPYGGGAGMVLKIQPIYDAVESLKPRSNVKGQMSNVRTILLSAKGKTFTQKDARRLAKYDQIIMICGRYEGVDERVAKYVADEEVSVGDYILFGGEVPAMVLIEAVSRLVPGVVAKSESVKEESFSNWKLEIGNWKFNLEYPQYTRPEVFVPKTSSKYQVVSPKSPVGLGPLLGIKGKKWKVPKVLLSGDHKKIEEWREKHSKLAK